MVGDKAYIPLRRKTTHVGYFCVTQQKRYQHVSFALGDANFSHHPTQNPNASQWNIGCIGFQRQNSCVGHVHSILFVSISFALGSQCKHSFFSGIWA